MSTQTPHTPSNPPLPSDEASFAETALRLGGKSEEEVRRTGAMDKADELVEKLFQPQYQTDQSPAHRAVWDRGLPVDLFQARDLATPDPIQEVMDASLEVVRRHRAAGTVLDERHKIRNEVLADLGNAGYWGLLVEPKYGGSGAPFRSFAPFLTQMAMLDPTLAGLASVHGCIGAVDPVRTFGNDDQKQRFLPDLASGRRLSAFALTEPCAGSDLTALRTRARLQGDHYLVTGEKLFITNVVPGRTIGLVCLIDDAPAVLIVDLPGEETDQFQLRKYGLYALKHTFNQGIVFRDFRVPAENLLVPPRGNGLTIAYHGLNLGRIALCANAAGTMRVMMAGMLPWSQFRVTYGEPIARRELVRRRLARLAARIVACDALVAWCSSLIDLGYRGEMECIVAKIYGSESQKEAAIEMCMKTHGGRSFLHGHMFGDHVHEFLAPCIYEGEGEMLGMAFFKSLVKHHGQAYFEPLGRAMQAAGIRKPNPLNPAHAWALSGAVLPYARWLAGQYLLPKPRPQLPPLAAELRPHAQFAAQQLQAAPREISGVMSKHQLKLADRQCRMSELSARIQQLIVLLCTTLYAQRQDDEVVRQAADVLGREITSQLTGRRPSDSDFRAMASLGETIADGGFRSIAGLDAGEILMPY
jgi:alkylation response protein AidB-like acyl-CoA dehydrogenase